MRFSGVWHAKAFELRLVRKKSLFGTVVEILCAAFDIGVSSSHRRDEEKSEC